jgi:acetolactate synthase-1/2/3 large subunit
VDRQAYPLNRPRQWLTSGGLGTMGFGLPAAVGAALANPDRKVICFSGDGSLMMNIQEMATAAENQLDVKIILMNNEALGLVHQQQSLFYKQGVFAATYPGMINFMQIAAGFGLQTCDLNAKRMPTRRCRGDFSPGPALIHVRIDPNKKCIRWCRRVRQILKWWGNKPCRNNMITSFWNSPSATTLAS